MKEHVRGREGKNMLNQVVRKSVCCAVLITGIIAVPEVVRAGTNYEPYTFTTLAGSSTSGHADGQGSAAQFSAPFGIAVDSGGTIYVADTQNNTIRKVSQDGAVTTFAGLAGASGSTNGQGTAARFNNPSGITVDKSGNVYVADTNNFTIRKITPAGAVTTLAGSPGQHGSTDGTGSAARFFFLGDLAVDGSGNVIVADYANQTIRKVTPGGSVTTIAGAAGQQGATNGPALQARFKYPRGVAVDSSGNIYISDEQNNLIRKLSTNGTVSTLAGPAGGDPSGGNSDGTGAAAHFQFPEGLATDKAGNVYVSDSNNALVRKVTPGGVVTTLGGAPSTSGTADGTGNAARFSTPEGMAVDAFGTLYLTDCFGNNAIRKGKAPSAQPVGFSGVFGLGRVASLEGNSEDAGSLLNQFIISGSTSQLNMLMRGLGPSLASSGIANALQDPTLVLSSNSTGQIVWRNDNWQTGDPNSTYPSQKSLIQQTGVPPTDNRESAFIVGLPPGQYTVTERGKFGATGAASNEAFLLSGQNSFIPAIGSRGETSFGDNTLAMGWVIPEGQPMSLLVRALGPSLKNHGISTSFLQNPVLDVVDNNGTSVGHNDNWQDEQTTQINKAQKNFAFPLATAESASVLNLQPGHYVARVTGKNNTAGVAFIQAYELDSNGVAITKDLDLDAPTPDAYPRGNVSGLSATVLTVNGKTSASALPVDYPIVFEATQSDTNDLVQVRVQSAPGVDGPWTNLNTGFGGLMIFNSHDNKYVLTTENYPIGSNIFFRAVSEAAGQAESISAPVGSFNISSSKPHLPPTQFQIEGMTQRFLVFIAAYPLDFFATINSQASGLGLRLQSSTTPEVESSWSDISGDGLHSVGNGAFDLRAGNYPSGTGIYFRVVASATGYGDSISNFVGPFDLTQNALPHVTITAPSGSGTDSSPLQVSFANAQNLQFSATGSDSNGSVKSVQLFDNGNLVSTQNSSSATTTLQLSQGKHTLTAVATDNVGGKGSTQIVIQVAPAVATATRYVLTQSGDWNNPSNWQPNGVPGPFDTADVGSNTASIGSGVHITVASLSGGNLSGAGASSRVTVTKNFLWTGGTISKATLEIANGAQGEIKAVAGGPDFTLNSAAVINDVGGTITVDVDSFLNGSVAFHGKNTGSSLNNAGEVTFNSPTLEDQTTSPFLVQIVTSEARKKLQGLASITNSGTCHLNGVVLDLSSTTSGDAHMRAVTAPTGFIQAGGVLDFGPLNQAGTIIGNLVVNGGTVTGSGAVVGNLTNNAGLIVPGHSAGVLSVTGNFTQGSGGTLLLEVGGVNAHGPDYDQLQVGGTASLGGTLDVKTINGFKPKSTDSFTPLSYSSSTGKFSTITSNATFTVGSTGASMKLSGVNPPPAQLLNISTRMEVLTDNNVLIAGFIVTGAPGSSKKVMIRGLGPSLANRGVPNPLADPLLELHKPDGTIITNDNWKSASNTGEIPAGFQPTDQRESVIVATLTVGSTGFSNFTAVLKGAHGETGVGLAEAYDLTAGSGQLANISTRGFVDRGDNAMIGGFIVGGTQPSSVLVRAIGPSLIKQGVQGALQSTSLAVYDKNGNVITNQGWRATQESEIIATTIPPKDDRDSAIRATLLPGNYTAVVRGGNDTTGIGLVEAYNLQ
jgi:sugar lactone lactonase YvrE